MRSAYLPLWCAATLIIACPALAAPAGFTAADVADARRGEIVQRDVPVGDGAAVKALFFCNAPPAVALQVLWDHARYIEFMPHAITSRVLEQHGDTAMLEQIGGQGPFKVAFVTRRHRSAHGVSWTLVRGDILKNDGAWEVASSPPGCLLSYRVHVVPKGPVPQGVQAFLQRQALPDQCAAVRRRVEAMAKHK